MPSEVTGPASETYRLSATGEERRSEKKKKKIFLFKVEQNGKYNTSEFAITST